MSEERFQTQHPDSEKQGENIVKWKYDAVRRVILDAVPCDDEGIAFSQLSTVVREGLEPKNLAELGSVNWYTTVVKLDLEARGEIRRLPGRGPQRLARS